MPAFNEVNDYLEANSLESELSECVAACVDAQAPQPLAVLAAALAKRAAEVAVDWNYQKLTSELRALVAEKGCGPALVRLSFQDGATYSTALGGGGPNAALRFVEGGEGGFASNAGLIEQAVLLLEPIKQRHANISRADLWAHAANVAIEAMGGPRIITRFGRTDAAGASDTPAPSDEDLLFFNERANAANDPGAPGAPAGGDRASWLARVAADLRSIYHAKGFNDREIVALAGRRTVCELAAHEGGGDAGRWTADAHHFDNAYFVELLRNTYAATVAKDGVVLMRCATSGRVMLPSDEALLHDPVFRTHVDAYSAGRAKFFADFGAAWSKLQELGRAELLHPLAPHPLSLTYVTSCVIPNEWFDLPLATKRECAADAVIYGFGLKPGVSLALPVCARVQLLTPGSGDGRDLVSEYAPISEEGALGRFELLVRAEDAAAAWLGSLRLGEHVAFRHTAHDVGPQYPFLEKKTFTLICDAAGVAPAYQLLLRLMRTRGDERKAVLICASRCASEILLRDEIGELALAQPHRLTVIHVLDSAPAERSQSFIVESGAIDKPKIEKYAFAPKNDTLLFVSGEHGMYAALCGPREDKLLKPGTVLEVLGYSSEMVLKL